MFISKTAFFTFLIAELLFVGVGVVAFEKGRSKAADLATFLGCVLKSIVFVANKIKLLVGILAMALVGLSDKLTGIDATGFITKVTGGDPQTVGAYITGAMISVAVARFIMQSGILAGANRNGVDNPET